jgi:hypothetical protein
MDDNKPKKPSAADSPTGILPRMSIEEIRQHMQESPQPPPDLPEFDADDAITGIWPVAAKREGEDTAKNADDNPTKGAEQS